MKSIRTAARVLQLPPATVHKILRKRLQLYAYKMQMLQALQPNDKLKQKEFAVNMLNRISGAHVNNLHVVYPGNKRIYSWANIDNLSK